MGLETNGIFSPPTLPGTHIKLKHGKLSGFPPISPLPEVFRTSLKTGRFDRRSSYWKNNFLSKRNHRRVLILKAGSVAGPSAPCAAERVQAAGGRRARQVA